MLKVKKIILSILVICITCSTAFANSFAEENPTENDFHDLLNVTETVIEVEGLTKKYTFLHVTDTHTLLIDEDDPIFERASKAPYAYFKAREAEFYVDGIPSSDRLEAMYKYAEEQKVDGVLLTGDIVDAPSQDNLDFFFNLVNEYSADFPSFYTFGNHDWTTPDDYYGSSYAVSTYRPLFNNLYNIYVPARQHQYFDYVEFDDLIIVSLDNSNDNFSQAYQYDYMVTQLAKNKPTIVLMHVPFQEDTLSPKVINRLGRDVTLGLPGSGAVFTSQMITSMYNTITGSDNVAAIFAGHVHFNHEGTLANNTPQYITSTGSNGSCRLVTLKPPACEIHTWVDATCTEPKTCSVCGEVDSEFPATGHNFTEATCTEDSVCTVCNITGDEALGHNFNSPTCVLPATCTRCGEEGDPALGHDYENSVCNTCGDIMYGDINGDEAIDDVDDMILSRYLAMWEVTINEVAADVNDDGNIDDIDNMLLTRFLANWDVDCLISGSGKNH